MRRSWILGLVVIVFAVGASAAVAASPHFKKGGTPTCSISTTGASSTTTCTGTLAGLSGTDLYVNTIVNGFATYTCTNQGGNAAPGQNQVAVGPSNTVTGFPAAQQKNGNLTFTTNPNTLSASDTVTGTEAGCPNNNWQGTNPQLTVTSVELQIGYVGQQPFYDCTVAPSGSTATFPASC